MVFGNVVDNICHSEHDYFVAWDIEFVTEAEQWWYGLDSDERAKLGAAFDELEQHGPLLPTYRSKGILTSRHREMRELRIQHRGRPYRVLFAFDPRRVAIILFGGDKTGDDRWYVRNVPIADKRLDRHLEELNRSSVFRKNRKNRR